MINKDKMVGWLFACGLAWCVAFPSQGEPLRPQLDDLVDHFIHVVFGREYENLSTKPPVISKWQGPVAINVQGRSTPRLIAMASHHIQTLSNLTGLRFHSLKKGETTPSIDLVFLKRAEMGNLSGPNLDTRVIKSMAADPSMVCYFLAWHSPPERIVKALVVVNVERTDDRINACLLEELTQVMGLPNDVDSYWPSIFQPLDASLEHSQWDKLYIRTLYDPRLKPGMGIAESKRIVRGIFAEALSSLP